MICHKCYLTQNVISVHPLTNHHVTTALSTVIVFLCYLCPGWNLAARIPPQYFLRFLA